MAEKTLEDVIKVLRSNNLDQKGRADQTYAATLSVAQEVATLSTLLKKNFAAQQAAQGDRLEKEREERRKAYISKRKAVLKARAERQKQIEEKRKDTIN